MTNFKNKAARFLASGFYISYIPAALTGFRKFTGSGLFGTALGLLLVPLLPAENRDFLLFLTLFFFFAVWVAGLAEASFGVHDDPRIVIDEILGYWVAVAFLDKTIFNLAAAFVLFRILDTLKPWPIKKIDQTVGGGFGIIIDDVLAAVAANLMVRFLNFAL
ncbi:MAG: phosphatidylglycerophosphatase A [Elusimicrobia bacterium]|nr:phosphatidylglycerophosphatase A [Elusimicrobiota bacterium]